MLRALSVLISLSTPTVVSAQLMVDQHVVGKADTKIRVATAVPKALTGKASLRFEVLDICFDGGSHGAFFKRDNASELVLFFPHPGYWSDKAKRESRQPVAIQGKTLVEIAPDSPLESRMLELLAGDIADGQRDRDTTLTLIRIRDCLLHRKPLAEITERYDPKTWEPRPDKFGFGDASPFGNGKHTSKHDEP